MPLAQVDVGGSIVGTQVKGPGFSDTYAQVDHVADLTNGVGESDNVDDDGMVGGVIIG